MNIKQCYSCYDQIHFQLFGQTEKYWSMKHQKEYLDTYIENDYPVIECEVCGSRVKLQQLNDGKWHEVFVPTINKN